ncbi:MAG: ankyrin repeat domain-containing protein [Candidatus Micrarchaeota archaeon]|nr:ankyrin repeat domain-containing protein [Candidatus Micrarchaeota archaeon]
MNKIANKRPVNVLNQELRKWAQSGLLSQVKDVLSQGADINSTGMYGWTPLMVAVMGGHIEVVRFLLEQGANPSLQSSSDRTAMDYCLSLKGPKNKKMAKEIKLLIDSYFNRISSAPGDLEKAKSVLEKAVRKDNIQDIINGLESDVEKSCG